MPFGLNMLLWTTHVTEGHLPLLETLKKTGYDGVEVPVMGGEVAHYEKMAKRLDDIGLARTCSTALPSERHNPISADATERQAGVDFLKGVVERSHALGGELLCGPFFQPLGLFSGDGPTEAETERATEAHRQMADFAADSGVEIAVEFLNRFECYFMNTTADAADHARAVDRPNFGVLYDTFHANIEETDPVGAIAQHADAIRHVHISENHRGTPGSGHIDWPATFRALRAIGYDRWLVIEAFGRALPDLAAATRVWRDFFPSREEVYTEGLKFLRREWDAAS